MRGPSKTLQTLHKFVFYFLGVTINHSCSFWAQFWYKYWLYSLV